MLKSLDKIANHQTKKIRMLYYLIWIFSKKLPSYQVAELFPVQSTQGLSGVLLSLLIATVYGKKIILTYKKTNRRNCSRL